jgi:hypothetical protein
MEGSSETGGVDPGGLVTTYRADQDALLRATEVWGLARIGFVSVVLTRDGMNGVPVINDPDGFQATGEQVGDIDAPSGDPFEALEAAWECHRTWNQLDPDMKGPVVVTVRQFVHAGPTLAGASHPDFALWAAGAHPLGGRRGDDMCGEPRQLSLEDVFEIDRSSLTHTDVGWLIIAQPNQFRDLDHRSRGLAHELGHVLFLGHGNGADDNSDGSPAGPPGSRRFDEYCDPLGSTTINGASFPREDVASTDTECRSIMHPRASCNGLTELQIEQARAAAALMPGCSGIACKK